MLLRFGSATAFLSTESLLRLEPLGNLPSKNNSKQRREESETIVLGKQRKKGVLRVTSPLGVGSNPIPALPNLCFDTAFS